MRDTDYFSVNMTLRRCSTKIFLAHDFRGSRSELFASLSSLYLRLPATVFPFPNVNYRRVDSHHAVDPRFITNCYEQRPLSFCLRVPFSPVV